MDSSKLLKTWNDLPRMFRAANMHRWNNNTAPMASSDTKYSKVPPEYTDFPCENETNKHSEAGGSSEHSENDFDNDTNAPTPGDNSSDDAVPKSSTGIAADINKLSRRACNYIINKADMAMSQTKDHISDAIQTAKEKGLLGTAKEAGAWMKAHPKETAMTVIPLVAVLITVIVLSATGFGAAGVAAGSTAAIIQAGIGNVVAHSFFATCTSAMMGGYGAPIIFGGVWLLATAVTAATVTAWKRWRSRNEHRLILAPRAPPKDFAKQMNDAVDTVMFSSTLVAAYASYRIKSWMQSHKKLKRD